MAKSAIRQRRGVGTRTTPADRINKSASSKTNSPWIVQWVKRTIATLVLGAALGLGYRGYIETRVNTPLAVEKAVILSGLQVPDRFWGTYRPGHYVGLRTREPHSLLVGAMWYWPGDRLGPGGQGIRHWSDHSEGVGPFGYHTHDGLGLAEQRIQDGQYVLETSWIKRRDENGGPGDWSLRISVKNPNSPKVAFPEEISIIFYLAYDEKLSGSLRAIDSSRLEGESPSLGHFTLHVRPKEGSSKGHSSFLHTKHQGLDHLREAVASGLRLESYGDHSRRRIILGGFMNSHNSNLDPSQTDSPLVAIQVSGIVPFSAEAWFESTIESTGQPALLGTELNHALKIARASFDQRFEKTFKLASKGFSAEKIIFSKAIFSNLLGGIGYWYGASRVQTTAASGAPVAPYWKSGLFSAIPGRSSFPRPFLWDEGFHHLLIGVWDPSLQLDITAHWLDLVNAAGWIPREQILDAEALARVPEEFVTQKDSDANPPMLLLALERLLDRFDDNKEAINQAAKGITTLERLFPRFDRWIKWFNESQVGELPGSYRWRGRDPLTDLELNPKTLACGLDDYPRASHPNHQERHVDLRCWQAAAANAMTRLAEVLDQSSDASKWRQAADYLNDVNLLDSLHWSEIKGTYCDYGLHTDRVELVHPKRKPGSPGPPPPMRRLVKETPVLRLIESAYGFVSLSPLVLDILPHDSPRLGRMLSKLNQTEELWTPYGLRSLSAKNPLYHKYNTEHDPPYWRGAIWFNFNYLTCRALYRLSSTPGPYKAISQELYRELRQNLIQNVFRQWKSTGFVWESYDDITGQGRGVHPFTGWTSLIVAIMAEIY